MSNRGHERRSLIMKFLGKELPASVVWALLLAVVFPALVGITIGLAIHGLMCLVS